MTSSFSHGQVSERESPSAKSDADGLWYASSSSYAALKARSRRRNRNSSRRNKNSRRRNKNSSRRETSSSNYCRRAQSLTISL